ncbi:MAG: hypothetical protein GY699_11580 [Desulfobacteraceae bacterium]|nr:hypothetical protein [Desulfobacteraceae bacterium]
MPLFNSQSKALIQNWDKSTENQVRIKLITSGHEEDHQFINFANQLMDITSKLAIESEKGETNLPNFRVQKNIIYSALPLEKEFEPFLEALSLLKGMHSKTLETTLSKSIRQTLEKIDIPVRLKLYIALQCPHCPNVVRTVIPLALACKNIHLHIIDGSLFPEIAQKDAVMSAPCLLLEDDFRWTGSVDAQEIVSMIISRDPSKLSIQTLKNILEQGDASWIAQQMIEKGKIFDAFIKLLLHDTWSVRLGAMVVVEEIAETDPMTATLLSPILIKEFDKKDITIQGDILYALGEAGTQETKEWINSKLGELEHQDLIDAAKEAIETLESENE